MTKKMTADKYRELFRLRAEGKLPPMECSKFLLERLKKVYKPGMKVLDVGCGVGHYYQMLKQLKDLDYTGVDIDSKMIDIAQDVWKDDNNAKFFTGNINSLFLANGSYDIVICYNVLLHLPDFKDGMKELLRVSKRYVFIRSLFGKKEKIVHTKMVKGCEDVYDSLFYNRYSYSNVRSSILSDKFHFLIDFDDDVVSIPDGNESKLIGVDKSELTSGKDMWRGKQLKYQVLSIEKCPRILAIIPCRKGSKRLPDKNVLPFCGKPLWRWTYDAAKGSKYISDVVVSTDDERIVAALPDCAVSVRLPGLCGDGVSSEDVMLYEIEKQKELGYEYDYVLLLQPTSPLRNADDIDDMIKYAIDHKYHAVASGYKLSKPVYQCTLLRDAIVMNGAMYLIRMDRFLKYKSVSTMLDDIYLMPEERSADIDTLYDFEVARLQYKFMRKMRCKDAVGAST